MRTKTVQVRRVFDDSYKGDAPSLFNRGVLRYAKSGHTLTTNEKYFVCSENQKGRCDLGEKPILITDFEQTFFELSKRLEITFEQARDINLEFGLERLEFALSLKSDADKNRGHINNEIEAIKSDLRGQRNPRVDFAFLKKSYFELLKIGHCRYLAQMVATTVLLMTDFAKSREMKPLEMLTEYIFLSDDGRIEMIKLEGLGDYLFQYLEKRIPGFSARLGMPIIDRLIFSSLELEKAMKQFKNNDFRDSLSYTNFSSKHRQDKFIAGLFKNVRDYTPKETIEFAYLLRDILWLDETCYFAPVEHSAKSGRGKRKTTDQKLFIKAPIGESFYL